MSDTVSFPSLEEWEPTRQTLQLVSRVLGVVPRSHAEFHPKWWHISLKVQPDGLVTERVPLTDGGELWFKIDLRLHKVLLFKDDSIAREFSLTEGLMGLTASQFGDQVLEAVADLGLSGQYAREKFENDDPRDYNPEAAERFLTALVNADRVFKDHRAKLSGDAGPVQLWPHGFDLAFEWFGTRVVTYEHEGEVQEHPSQLNLGFYPGDPDNAPYFFSNAWPFDADKLLGQPLPTGASWHTEGWEGTYLPYSELAGTENGEERLADFARAVFDLCSPTLLI